MAYTQDQINQAMQAELTARPGTSLSDLQSYAQQNFGVDPTATATAYNAYQSAQPLPAGSPAATALADWQSNPAYQSYLEAAGASPSANAPMSPYQPSLSNEQYGNIKNYATGIMGLSDMTPQEKAQTINVAASQYGVRPEDIAYATGVGVNDVNAFLGQGQLTPGQSAYASGYGTGLTGALADQKISFDEAARLHRLSADAGIIPKYTRYSPDVTGNIDNAYFSGLGSLAKNVADTSKTAADRYFLTDALQSEYGVNAADWAKALNIKPEEVDAYLGNLKTQAGTELTPRWQTAGAMHDNVSVDPFVGEKLYRQLASTHGAVSGSLGREYWSGEGYGSTEENTKAFANSLARLGITDLSKVGIKEVPVTATSSFYKDENGQWLEYGTGGSEAANGVYQAARVINSPEFQQKLNEAYAKQPKTDAYGDYIPSNVLSNYTFDTGNKRNALINKDTGQVYDVQGNRDVMGTGKNDTFYVGRTFAGEGRTGFELKAVTDENGNQHLVPVTTYSQTGDWDLVSMGLTFASMIPGVAPFAAAANALMQADKGNWGGAILSGIGAIPGLNTALDLGLNADTLSNIKNVGSGLNIANALQKGDLSGLAGGIAGLTGVGNTQIGDTGVSVGQAAQGLTAAQAASKGDWVTAALAGTAATGAKTLPGTDVTIPQASSIVGLTKALESGNPYAMLNAAQKAALTVPKKAAGGLISNIPAGTIPADDLRRAMTGIAALGA